MSVVAYKLEPALGARKEEPLKQVASQLNQCIAIMLSFDSFTHERHPEITTKVHH
jgi:hypothetical protein